MFDPSIGQESITGLDILGVLLGHLIFGFAATFLFDWSWIPLSEKEKSRGKSLQELKKNWRWYP